MGTGAHKTLEQALEHMALGSKSAFQTFFSGTVNYVYSSARLLFPSHDDACQFTVDLYQYLYLHLPQYDRSQNLEKWISQMIYARYRQLSIGRELPEPSIPSQMQAGTAALSREDRTRIWHQLEKHMHFPPEPLRRSPVRIALILSVILLVCLVASRYIPDIVRTVSHSESAADASPDVSDALDETSESDTGGQGDDSMAGDSYAEDNNDTDSDGWTPDNNPSDAADQQFSSSETTNSQNEDQTASQRNDNKDNYNRSNNNSPTNNSSNTDSNSSSIDNLELQLHYGDSLLYGSQ